MKLIGYVWNYWIIISQLTILIILGAWTGSYQERTIIETDQVADLAQFAIARGTYEVIIDYQSDVRENAVAIITASNDLYFLTDQMQCYPFKDQGRIQIWAFRGYEDLSLVYAIAPNGELLELTHVQIIANDRMRRLATTSVLILFITFDAVYIWIRKIYMKSERPRATLLSTVVILVAVFACTNYVFDILLVGGSDYEFHFGRIFGMVQSIESGVYPPRILPYFYNGAGYATSLFYGDLILTIPALLYIGGVPISIAYHIFCLIISIATAGIAWYAFRLFANRFPATVATVVYTCSLYRQFVLITQARVGEVVAMCFMPLTFAGAYLIFRSKGEKKNLDKGWKLLAIGMAMTIMNHSLSTVMSVFLLAIWALFYLHVIFNKEVLKAVAKAILLAILLAAEFIVPFLEVMLSGDYVISNIISEGEVWALPVDRDALMFLWPDDSYTIIYGLLPTLMLGICVLYVLYRLAIREYRNRETYHYFVIVTMSVLVLYLSSCWFPWNAVANVPGFSTILRSIQFPSRFAAFETAFLAFSVCEMLNMLQKEHRHILQYALQIVMSLFATLIVINVWAFVSVFTDAGTQTAVKMYGITGMDLFVGYGSYASYSSDYFYFLKGTDRYQFPDMCGVPEKNANVEVEEYHKNGVKVTVQCKNLTEEVQTLKLPIVYYPYYQAVDTESRNQINVIPSETKALMLEIPADYSGNIYITVVSPWYWNVALSISVIGWTGLTAYGIKRKREKQA